MILVLKIETIIELSSLFKRHLIIDEEIQQSHSSSSNSCYFDQLNWANLYNNLQRLKKYTIIYPERSLVTKSLQLDIAKIVFVPESKNSIDIIDHIQNYHIFYHHKMCKQHQIKDTFKMQTYKLYFEDPKFLKSYHDYQRQSCCYQLQGTLQLKPFLNVQLKCAEMVVEHVQQINKTGVK